MVVVVVVVVVMLVLVVVVVVVVLLVALVAVVVVFSFPPALQILDVLAAVIVVLAGEDKASTLDPLVQVEREVQVLVLVKASPASLDITRGGVTLQLNLPLEQINPLAVGEGEDGLVEVVAAAAAAISGRHFLR